MNLVLFMDSAKSVCEKLAFVWTIFGYIIFAIKIVVPLLLVITGMITLAQAVMKQKEDDIKKAQQLLIHKIIAAVLVFLVIQIVSVVVRLVAGPNWKQCAQCATNPFGQYDKVDGTKGDCKIIEDNNNENYGIS